MSTSKRFSPEVRERDVRLVREAQPEHGSQWAVIRSIVAKIGRTHETFAGSARPKRIKVNGPAWRRTRRYL
jgi:hypothetical protein